MFVLKQYQKRTLEKLSLYLEQTRLTNDPEQAFAICREAPGYAGQYNTLPGMAEVPYICLRLPTGGGKTLLSAHTVSVAANMYLGIDYPIVLWLAPTDIIRKQTLETLKNPRHPNREVLDEAFTGRVRVFDITEFAQLRPADIGNSACIFVATFAAFRVKSTDGRKIYAHHEELEPHFSHMPKTADFYERDENGEVKYSFANLLAYYRPLVLVDEAHNHASSLSIEVLQRLRPSTIVEFTATPADNSNVLYKATASELKAEEMIKLPIVLTEHQTWEDAVTTAIQTREKLDQLARNEEEYIRPIVLFQAESRDRDITVDVIRNYLIDQENIPAEEIAVATGEQRELDGIDLFDSKCPVKYIITIQALKEGWDCSFAYILCSTAKVQSSKDAEQLLGRVLRMPYARERKEPDLNRAYAHVSVSSWSEAVGRIHDNLVNMGFEQVEADASIQYKPAPLPGLEWRESREIYVCSTEAPNTSPLNMILRAEAIVDKTEDGNYRTKYTVRGDKDLEELERHGSAIYPNVTDRTNFAEAISKHRGMSPRKLSPAQRGERIVVPQLCIDFGDGHFEPADRESFLPDGWSLLEFPVELDNFIESQDGHTFEIDINETRVFERSIDSNPLNFAGSVPNWTELQLITWFDRKLQQEDIPRSQLLEFIRRHLRYLQERRQIDFADIVRARFLLEKAFRVKIDLCRDSAFKKAIQHVLIQPTSVRVLPDVSMIFRDGFYPANSFYNDSFKFEKHFFPIIASMNPEEIECAKIIESSRKVVTWIRNLERQPKYALWFPTSKDKFYPDFIALLDDERILVVEYKGEHLATSEETREKELIGQLWAQQSGGRCLFVMATLRDESGKDTYQQINEIIG